MTRFNLTQKEFNNEETTYTAYGIQAVNGLISLSIDDISTVKEQVCQFISKLEQNRASLEHLPALVEDYIGEALTVMM